MVKKTRGITVTVENTPTVTLHMPLKSAQALMALMGAVVGSEDGDAPASYSGRVYDALESAHIGSGNFEIEVKDGTIRIVTL